MHSHGTPIFSLVSFHFMSLQVSQVSVTFKDIIAYYRKQPQSKAAVFRSVFIDLKEIAPPPAAPAPAAADASGAEANGIAAGTDAAAAAAAAAADVAGGNKEGSKPQSQFQPQVRELSTPWQGLSSVYRPSRSVRVTELWPECRGGSWDVRDVCCGSWVYYVHCKAPLKEKVLGIRVVGCMVEPVMKLCHSFFVVGAGVAQFLLTQANLLQRMPLCTHATARHG